MRTLIVIESSDDPNAVLACMQQIIGEMEARPQIWTGTHAWPMVAHDKVTTAVVEVRQAAVTPA